MIIRQSTARGGALVLAGTLAAALGVDLWRIPVQVYDAFGEILDAQRSPSVAASFLSAFGSAGYLRPLRIAQIKLLFDLSGGHYHLVYRGFHVLLIALLLWLFVRALRVRTLVDVSAAAVALTVLVGLHTFLGFAREAFPINHFLEIGVLCLAALNLAQARGGWWCDVGAGLTFVVAALTLESGLLVWVVFAAAWLAGYRGVSMRGLALLSVLLVGYAALRFEYLSTGLPGLTERDSGFLLERLSRDDLQRRFGGAPLVFYAYNVAASVLSVIASEPREGLFVGVRAWLQGDVPPQVWLGVGSSLVTTLVILGWAWTRCRRGLERSDADRLALIAVVLVAANAALSYAYTKDDIMAVAGVFYALAAYGACRGLLATASTSARRVVPAAATALLCAIATAWMVRSVGVHHVLGRNAFRVANDWASIELVMQREERLPADAAGRATLEQLRRDALSMTVPSSQLAPEWRNRWFGD